MLDLDGLSILLRFVLSLKRVMLLRGTTTPLEAFVVVERSEVLDFDVSSRLDLRNVLVWKVVTFLICFGLPLVGLQRKTSLQVQNII